MKKQMKKLLAILLAGIMVLGCTVMASATEPAATTETKTTITAANGNTQGEATSEGAMETDPIEIVLPVVAQDSFNMILDPHGLINKTNHAKYAEATSFSSDGRLYFETSAGVYSGDSPTLKIVNKSHAAVNLDLEVSLDKGGNDFNLVASSDALTAGYEESGKPIETVKAEMYMALVGGGDTQAVADPASADPVVTLAGDGEYVDGDVEVVFLDVDDVIEDALGDNAEDDAVAEFTESFEAAQNSLKANMADVAITLTFTAEDDSDSNNPVEASIDVAAEAPTGFTAAYASGVVTITNTELDAEVATITFEVVEASEVEDEDGTEQTISISIPAPSAKITTAIHMDENAYSYDYKESTDSYYWKIDTSKSVDTYPTVSFKLVGNINDCEAWDDVENESGISFTLTWTVKERPKFDEAAQIEAGYDYGDEANDNGGGNNGPTGDLPTVTFNAKSTGTTATKGAKVNWEAGTEDYADYVPVGVKYTNDSGEEAVAEFTDQGNNVLRFTTSVALKNGSDHVVVFMLEDDETDTIEVDLPDGLW